MVGAKIRMEINRVQGENLFHNFMLVPPNPATKTSPGGRCAAFSGAVGKSTSVSAQLRSCATWVEFGFQCTVDFRTWREKVYFVWRIQIFDFPRDVKENNETW
jgi:hypothetical protein